MTVGWRTGAVMRSLTLKGKSPSSSAPRLCPDCTDGSEWEPRGGVADDESREQRASPRPSRSKRSVRKPSVQTETKYIELMVVNDNDMVRFKIHVSN